MNSVSSHFIYTLNYLECSLTIWISWYNVIALQQRLLIDVNRVVVDEIDSIILVKSGFFNLVIDKKRSF